MDCGYNIITKLVKTNWNNHKEKGYVNNKGRDSDERYINDGCIKWKLWYTGSGNDIRIHFICLHTMDKKGMPCVFEKEQGKIKSWNTF